MLGASLATLLVIVTLVVLAVRLDLRARKRRGEGEPPRWQDRYRD